MDRQKVIELAEKLYVAHKGDQYVHNCLKWAEEFYRDANTYRIFGKIPGEIKKRKPYDRAAYEEL